jgi:VWFA-related protein
MISRHLTFSIFLSMLCIAFAGLVPVLAPAEPAAGQDSPQTPVQTSQDVIKAEANMVLVDVIATDKKGNYIRDLQSNEFHVFEDAREVPITSFTRAADAGSNGAVQQPRFVVLFFDNSTMGSADQIRARRAASQFVEKYASKDRLMAVADFSGVFRIAQNFTLNPDLLKKAVAGVKFSSVQPNEPGQTTEIASLGMPSPVQVRSDFAARSVLLAIRNLTKSLRAVTGRKSLILFSGGFPLDAERQSELTATIDAANKANVAIYPVDVRGLSNLSPTPGTEFDNQRGPLQPGFPPRSSLDGSVFPHSGGLLAGLLMGAGPFPQRGGAGGGTTGGAGTGAGAGAGTGGGMGGGRGGAGGTGAGTGSTGTTVGTPGTGTSTGGSRTGPMGNPPSGSRGGSTGYNPYGYNQPGMDYNNNPYRQIIPPFLDNASTNQQVLYALAAGTGGFTIFNTNDFGAGLEKISKELDEYYVLGYVPPNQVHDGSYHKIEVKVTRKGVNLRHRNGYFDVKSPDLLAGKPEGKILEERSASSQPGDFPLTLTAPYFYTEPNVARVNLALDVPADKLEFVKAKGKFHSQVNILGIAYRPDGSVAARFSDTVKLDYEKKELKEFTKGTYNYQTNFDIAPGKYNLKVVLGAGGEKFGKYEIPLSIDPYDGTRFHLSGLAFSTRVVPVTQLTSELDRQLLEERTPLVVGNNQFVPTSLNRFKRDERVGMYVEVYEPLLSKEDPSLRVGILYNVVDRNTNKEVYSSNTILVNDFVQKGNPVIPVGLALPFDKLQAGNYRLEVRARDSMGNVSPQHSADFALD